jgi:hypothetical protein
MPRIARTAQEMSSCEVEDDLPFLLKQKRTLKAWTSLTKPETCLARDSDNWSYDFRTIPIPMAASEAQ